MDTNVGTRCLGKVARGAAVDLERAINTRKQTMGCCRLAGINPARVDLHLGPVLLCTNKPFFVGVFAAGDSFKELDDTDVGIDMC